MIRRLALIPAVLLILLAGFAAALAFADVYYKHGASLLEAVIHLEEEALLEMLEEEPDDAPDEEAEIPVEEAEITEEEESEADRIANLALEEAPRFLWLAHRLDPWNPEILRNLGRMYELKVTEALAQEPSGVVNLNRALYYYRQSIAQRPAWPFGWKHIPMLKLKQDQLDKEFALAMERATTLGPWQWLVQVDIVDAGLAFWDDLPEEQQEIVRATIKRGLQIDSEIFAGIAEEMGLIKSAEEYLALESPPLLK